MKKIFIIVASLMAGFSAYAADLSISYQKDLSSQDPANDFLSFKGSAGAIAKDRFDPKKKVAAVTGASALGSTSAFNAYRLDAKGKATMPSALRNLFLFAVAADSVRTGDALSASKAADGTITIRFVHRGSAYEIVTDSQGKLALPTKAVRTRKIGHTDNAIGADFSSTGKVDGVNWDKVWDASIADGREVKSLDGKAVSKTGKIMPDLAGSELSRWSGAIQFSLEGKVLKAAAELDAVKP